MKRVKICSACGGSGYYDSKNSPKCGACNGLGVRRGKMLYRLWKRIVIKYFDKSTYDIEQIYEADRS